MADTPKRQASPALLARAAARGPARGAGHGGPANGPGWGGPAKGASTSRFEEGAPHPAPETIWEGRREAKALRDILAEHLPAVAQTWLEVMLDPSAPAQARIAAADKIAERVEGKARDPSQEAAGAALAGAISRKPVTEEEWEREHGAADLGAAAGTAARAN